MARQLLSPLLRYTPDVLDLVLPINAGRFISSACLETLHLSPFLSTFAALPSE